MQELFLHKAIESQILSFIAIGKKPLPLQCNLSLQHSFSFICWNRAQLTAIIKAQLHLEIFFQQFL